MSNKYDEGNNRVDKYKVHKIKSMKDIKHE